MMNGSNRWFSVLTAALIVSGASVVFAESKPAAAAKPATPAAAKATDDAKDTAADAGGEKTKAGEAPKMRKASARLTQPWKDLASLSEEQKTKILSIHHAALDEKKALEAKEHSDILALLSDDQKKELKDLETKMAADKKLKKPAKGDGDEEMKEEADATPSAAPAAMPKKK